MKKIGYGVFCWEGGERRSQRYGNVHLTSTPFGGGEESTPFDLDLAILRPLEGKKVRIGCQVTKVRDSGHLGDMALQVFPSKPELGETIVLGVGFLVLGEVNAWDSEVTTSIGLQPEDGRDFFWLDPRILYRLHDQTVDMFIEQTNDPCHPVPDLKPSDEGAIMLDAGGSIQMVTRKNTLFIQPKVTRLGDGMFMMGFDYAPGEPLNARFEDVDED